MVSDWKAAPLRSGRARPRWRKRGAVGALWVGTTQRESHQSDRLLPVVVGTHRGLASPKDIQSVDVGVMVLINCDGISRGYSNPRTSEAVSLGWRMMSRKWLKFYGNCEVAS